MKIRIALADDHRMFREALCAPLDAETDMHVVAQAGSGAEALAATAAVCPDVLVLDIALPDMNGIEVAQQVRVAHPGVHVVALSGYADKMFVDEMFKAGAHAYVLKSAGADELIAAIRAARRGHVFLSPELIGNLVPGAASRGATAPPLTVLGRREREVLHLIATGKRSAQIAAALGIATGTVNVHRRNLKKKLGLRSTAELTRYAIREGLQAV